MRIKISSSVAFLVFILVLILTGCSEDERHRKDFVTAENRPVAKYFFAEEKCYDGVVYVSFGSGTGLWGGAKFGPDSKVVTCKPMEK